MAISSANKNKISEKTVGNVLLVGICVSLTFIATGVLTLIFGTGNTHADTDTIIAISAIPREIIKLNPTAFFTVGILTMILTPVVRVLGALVIFTINKEYKYTIISFIVFALLVLSFIIGVTSKP